MNFQANGLYNQQVKPSPVDVIEQIITTGLTKIQIFDVKQNELINTDLYNTFNNFYISIVPGSENEFNFSFIIK